MNTDVEKSTFINQVVGKRIIKYNGKLTPTGAEIIEIRNAKKTEELTKGLISILCEDVDNSGRHSDSHTWN